MSDVQTLEQEIAHAPPLPQEEQFLSDDGDDLDSSDPYLYGWREIVHKLPNGKFKVERIPLTLEDILHPQVGDFRMHTDEHERIRIYLCNALSALIANQSDAIVLSDVRVGWGHPRIAPHGPDVAVMFGVRKRSNWSTFNTKREGARPVLVIEITSPATRNVDLVDKLDEYEQVGVEFYIIIDLPAQSARPGKRLLGWRLTPDGYVAMTPDERGWLWMEPLGAWLAITDERVVCYVRSGESMDEYVSVLSAKKAAEARARTAEQQARAAEQQARAAEQRARAAEAVAANEAHRRAELEALTRRLEEEVRRLQKRDE